MNISPELGVAIMMNNYFHDVATALMATSAFVMYALYRLQESMPDKLSTLFFLRAHQKVTGFAKFALIWIIVGGFPRTYFYTRFEWANAAGKGQVPALIVKHILIAILVVAGVYAWLKLRRKVAELREGLPEEMRNQV